MNVIITNTCMSDVLRVACIEQNRYSLLWGCWIFYKLWYFKIIMCVKLSYAIMLSIAFVFLQTSHWTANHARWYNCIRKGKKRASCLRSFQSWSFTTGKVANYQRYWLIFKNLKSQLLYLYTILCYSVYEDDTFIAIVWLCCL